MYFCKKCGTSLDVSKVNSENKTEKVAVKKKKITTISSLIQKIIEEDLSIDNFIIEIDMEELLKNPKFKKLSQSQKNSIIEHINQQHKIETNVSVLANFRCENCNFNEPINETISLLIDDKTNIVTSLKPEDYYLYVHDPTLYRTHNYSCKNTSCPSNEKNFKGHKEAVVTKHTSSFRPTYICTVCTFGWTI